jgi:hypothetical protein
MSSGRGEDDETAQNDYGRDADTGSIPAASTESSFTVEQRSTPGAGKGAAALPGVGPPSTGGVYALAGVPGYVKIGKASNIAERLLGVQTGHPVPLRLLAVLSSEPKDERPLHDHWRHLRSFGEWFRFDDELSAFIAERRDRPGVACMGALREVAARFGRNPPSEIDRYLRRLLPLSRGLMEGLAKFACERESLASVDFPPEMAEQFRWLAAQLNWRELSYAASAGKHGPFFDLLDAIAERTLAGDAASSAAHEDVEAAG